MNRSKVKSTVVLMMLTLTGCAWTTSVPIRTGNEDGFEYPICDPFLVVSGAKTDLLLVPNRHRARAVRFGTFLAKNNVKITFSKCGPLQVDSDQDSTAAVVALGNVLTEAAKQGGGGALFGKDSSSGDTGISFQMFEFVFDDYGQFSYLRPLIDKDAFVRVDASPAIVEKKEIKTSPKKSPPAKSEPSKKEDPTKKGTGS